MVNKTTSLASLAEGTCEHVGTRITSHEAEKLDSLVDAGMFLNRSDAVRTAIRQMVGEVKILTLRQISEAQARKEVLAYLEEREQAYPSDIADDLQLDYDLVLRVLRNLKKTGEAVPA